MYPLHLYADSFIILFFISCCRREISEKKRVPLRHRNLIVMNISHPGLSTQRQNRGNQLFFKRVNACDIGGIPWIAFMHLLNLQKKYKRT